MGLEFQPHEKTRGGPSTPCTVCCVDLHIKSDRVNLNAHALITLNCKLNQTTSALYSRLPDTSAQMKSLNLRKYEGKREKVERGEAGLERGEEVEAF